MKAKGLFKKEKNTERPLPITIICVMGLIGAVVSLPSILSGPSHIRVVGDWFPFYMAFSTIVSFPVNEVI